ncbi:MAG TPA: L-histidine N(alpha)-methyltransferase [Burkholderiales bacterium]|nr:L-histidine N(alpha)-methyltransferase [Burkholderiales bacterium]
MTTRPSSRREGVGIVRHYSLLTGQTSFLDDVLRGLALPQKAIPAKYFYDERGSQLFEKICDLPEYYPTRTEMAIMERHIGEMVTLLGPDTQLVELGSGASVKTRLLVDRLEPSLYVPIDISETALRDACKALALMFPWLNISAVSADFTRPVRLPEFVGVPVRRQVVYFPGSTIGNFTPDEALEFLKGVREIVGPGGMLLIGVDLKKEKRVLDAAYDDAQGITAEFNLNLLHRINRELGGDFQVKRFRHKAFYDEQKGWIEMHLESLYSQLAHVGAHRFDFRPGETIHTEISCKYSVEEFQRRAARARFQAEKVWTDPANLFAVHLLIAV